MSHFNMSVVKVFTKVKLTFIVSWLKYFFYADQPPYFSFITSKKVNKT